jgi:hypothetical protein
MKSAPYAQTYEDELLKSENTKDFRSLISFNKTFGTDNGFKIFVSEELKGLEV